MFAEMDDVTTHAGNGNRPAPQTVTAVIHMFAEMDDVTTPAGHGNKPAQQMVTAVIHTSAREAVA